MKIAIAQLNYTVGDFENNKVKIIDNIQKARENGAELVIFSEYAISGHPCYDVISSLPFLEACEESLIEIASHCDGISVLVGLPLLHEMEIISAAALIQNRRIVRYIGKNNIESRDEVGYISPSKGVEYMKIGGNKIAVVLGADITKERQYGQYADIVVNLHADPYARGVIEKRYNFFSYFSFRSSKPVFFVNHVGGQADVIFDGSSCAYTPSGKPIAILSRFREELKVIDSVNSEELTAPEQDKTQNIYRAMKLGLKDYFTKSGFKKACVGLSGGIDSAVVLVMAVEALGAENVRVLMMPSQFSSDHSVTDAVELADKLGIEYDVIPITETFKAVTETMKPILGGTRFGLAEENIQSRLRTVMLMALSNKFGHILLNTGNKSEASMGYSTLYGDSAGSIAPIGDLYKSEVYDLARYINREEEIIPQNILSKEPSAELRPNQKDSDSLPLYDILDAIIYRFIEEGQSIEEIVNAGFDRDTVYQVVEQIKRTEFKRQQEPPAFRLSTKPYGADYRLPLINKFSI